MSKKEPVSVRGIEKKNGNILHAKENTLEQKIISKPRSFELMYRQVLKEKKNNLQQPQSILLQRKNSSPISTYRSVPLSSHRTQASSRQKSNAKKRSKEKNVRKKQQKREEKQLLQKKDWKQFDDIIQKLDHDQHYHIQQNACFLTKEQVLFVLEQLNYGKSFQIEEYVSSMLNHLKISIYGGVSSQNLKIFLQIISGDLFPEGAIPKHPLPSNILDNNFRMNVSLQQSIGLYNYYQPMKWNREYNNTKSKKFETFDSLYQRQKSKKSEDKVVQEEKQSQNYLIDLKNKLNEAMKISFEENNFVSSDKKPLLSVDISLGEEITSNIIVYEGQTADAVAQRLSENYTISQQTKEKFKKMLDYHMSKLLWKIQQESEELVSDIQ